MIRIRFFARIILPKQTTEQRTGLRIIVRTAVESATSAAFVAYLLYVYCVSYIHSCVLLACVTYVACIAVC